MQIRVLGCYGSETLNLRTSCFLINNRVLLDAGAITSGLSLPEQADIDAILISHAHLDHIQDIGFLADNIFGKRQDPVKLYGTKETIEFIREHILNNFIWPDFTAIPDKDHPVLTYETVKPGREFTVNGLKVKAVEVDHSVPTVGYIISDNQCSIVYSADTGPTQKLWKEAGKLDNLAAVIIEASFPNEMAKLAEISGHLTPGDILPQIDKIKGNSFSTYIFHMKAQYLEILTEQITGMGDRLIILQQGDQINL